MKFKKGFESSFALLQGFCFADAESRENALWAALWAHEAATTVCAFRPPLVAITGPQGCGKSTLAERLAALANVAFVSACDVSGVIAAASKGVRMVCLDDFQMTCRSVSELCRFVSASQWEGRTQGKAKKKSEPITLACLTIITGNGLMLPSDLARRAVVIRLGECEA